MKTFRGIYQFFRFQGNAGVADASTTGFPEDCSMVVIAMTCMAFLAHTVLTTCLAEPVVFADNWSFVANSLQSLAKLPSNSSCYPAVVGCSSARESAP